MSELKSILLVDAMLYEAAAVELKRGVHRGASGVERGVAGVQGEIEGVAGVEGVDGGEEEVDKDLQTSKAVPGRKR